MKNAISIFSLTLILGTLACGSATPLPTPESAPVIETSQPSDSSTPEVDRSPEQNPVDQSPVPAPSGLQVVYIREGNLWSWTESGGKVQLTGTSDMSTARLSPDGQVLAFMRGREVWTVGMDGMNARMLSTQANDDGTLWFSSDGLLLAVSTTDHIDVITLQDATLSTVMNYPALPDGYYPEVIWSPDGMGFKTVIPPQAEAGQAELLFVFTDGTVASLAKFTMVSLSESFPHISPDGGYIIYVAKSGVGKEALYLMDSSGATKPFGEPAEKIRANGWLPDSKRFVYGSKNIPRAFLGDVNGALTELTVIFPSVTRWVDAEHYLALEDGNLVLGNLKTGNVPIDSAVQDFDFLP